MSSMLLSSDCLIRCVTPHLQVHLRLAQAYMACGQPEYALDVCTTAIELQPSCATLWLSAARAHMELGNLGTSEVVGMVGGWVLTGHTWGWEI